MPPEIVPVGTFPKSEATPRKDLQSKTLEELQELVEWPSKMAEILETQDESQLLPQPEPPPPAPVEPAPEPEPQQEPPASQAAAPETPAEPNREDVERELLQARIEAAEAHAKKMEARFVGREAGEKGYIKQLQDRIRRLEAGVSAEPEQVMMDREEPSPSPVTPMRDGVKAWATQQAAKEAVSNFMQSHPDVAEIEQDTARYLQDSGFNFQNILNLDDPIAASREMTRTLDEAYWHVKHARSSARIAELQTRKADQVRGLEEAKRKASASAAGAPPVAPAQRKTTADLSLTELEARMRALGRR